MAKRKKFHIVYGETMPVWHTYRSTVAEVVSFVREHLRMGDVIFTIEEVSNG